MRFIGRRDRAGAGRARRADGVGGGADRRQRPHHALRRLQLRRAGGDRRRGAHASTGDDEEEFRAHLYAPEMHDPDLIIRTSGEQRLSNYLLWQTAYSELHLPRRAVAGLRPRRRFEAALAEYGARRRRFGGRAGVSTRRHAAPDGGEPPSARRTRRPARRNAGSDLGARVLVAIPAALAVIVVNAVGGLAVHARAARVGCVCLHELYAMLEPCGPVRLAGFLALAGLLVAAAVRRRSSRSCSRAVAVAAGAVRSDGVAVRAASTRRSRWRARCSASTGSASRSRTPCCCAGCRTATRS